jgi:hypothetical protein
MEINLPALISLLSGPPGSTNTLIAIASIGAVLGFLAGCLRCRARSSRCPAVPGISIAERVTTLAWTVSSGMIASIGSHWFVSSGGADRAIQTIKRLISQGSSFG